MTKPVNLALCSELERLLLCCGVDHTISTKDFSVELSWHSPSTNVGWYPIVEVEDLSTHKTIFWSEGPESWQAWTDWLLDCARHIRKKVTAE